MRPGRARPFGALAGRMGGRTDGPTVPRACSRYSVSHVVSMSDVWPRSYDEARETPGLMEEKKKKRKATTQPRPAVKTQIVNLSKSTWEKTACEPS